MMMPIRPLVACVIDLRPGSRQPDPLAIRQAVGARRRRGQAGSTATRWHEEVEYLFHSLRHFGGSLADAPAEVHHVGAINPELARRLRELEVTLKPVSVLEPRHPPSNKLRMLETTAPYDVLVMLDGDMVVAADFAAFLSTDSVGVVPVDIDRMTTSRWTLLYDYVGLAMPTERCGTAFHGHEIVPYFNSAVLLVPHRYAELLHEVWLYYIRLLLDRWHDLPAVLTEGYWERYFTDENALALALSATRLPYTCLPLEMNFPTNVELGPAFPKQPIRIIHQHHRVTREGLMVSTYGEANEIFERLNELVHAGDGRE